MDTALIIIVLVIVLLAIAVLPRFLRDKARDSADLPSGPANASAAARTPRSPKVTTVTTAEEIDAQPFTRWLCDQACAQTGTDLRQDPIALSRIAEAAAQARDEIDKRGEYEISLPYISADAQGPKNFTLKVTREQLARIPQRMI
jgi:hypothetical protein